MAETALDKIRRIRRNAKKFSDPKFVSDLVNRAIMAHEQKLIQLNTQNQLYSMGVDSKGLKIRPKDKPYSIYSPRYEREKRRAGLYQGHIDLSFTGDYLDSFHVEYLYQKIILEATDVILDDSFNLSEHLKEFYGADIEGLTAQNTKVIADIIRPTLFKLYKYELFEK